MRAAATPLIAFLLAAPLVARAAEPVPTADDLQKLADAKDWPGLLQATTRVLTLKGPAAAGVDRVDAWLKKAEAQVQTSLFVPASVSFEKASEEPNVDPAKADLAVATAAVVRKSDRHGYKPAATKANPQPAAFDILDPANRPAAISAYSDVALAEVTQKADKLKPSGNPGPLLELIKQAAALRPVDRVVNRSTEKTDALQKKVGESFAAAAKAYADTTAQRLTAIETDANTQVQTNSKDARGRTVIRTQAKGLTPAVQTELRKLNQATEDLAGTYTTIEKALAAAAKPSVEPAKGVLQAVYDKGKAVLSASYRTAQRTGGA